MNIGQTIDPAVQRVPDRIALIVGDRQCSYRELELWVRRVAAALVAHGVRRGARVALVDNGSVLSVATILAAARIGASSAQMNIQLTTNEQAQLAAGVEAQVGVAGEPFRERLAEAIGQNMVVGENDLDDYDDDFDDTGEITCNDDGEALVLFTSGTTGLPKPIFISHGAVTQRVRVYASAIDPQRPPAVDMMSAPIFHIGGTLGLLITLRSANQMVLLPRFDAGSWLRAVEEHRVSRTFLVPTMLERILGHPDFPSRDLSSLRQISYGAAAAPVALVERALDALPHVDFMNVFGQTETLGAYAALTADDHRSRRKLGSAGRCFPGVELRIVDTATGGDCGVGEVGEAWVRSAENVDDDWLRTGDLASLDDEGYLHPVGRLKDTINRGGEKFGPIEVEEVLRSHPRVRDVGVAGVPDPEMGQRVGAVVVADGEVGASDLRTFCVARLARYKLPELIVFADDLPYSNLGKVSRKALTAVILDAQEKGSADHVLHA